MAFRQIFLSLKKSKLLLLLLAVFFVKQLLLVAVFPMFQGPDEPAHYSTIQYYSQPKQTKDYIEKNSPSVSSSETFDFSEEISKTSELIRTEEIRFHTSAIKNFTENQNGKFEEEIKNSIWKKYIPFQKAKIVSGVPGYYFVPSYIERLLSTNNIFIRFFIERIFSVFLGLLIVLFSFLTARKIGFDERISFLLSAIIAFQPMFSQTAAIINYDIMLIFTFALFAYGAVCALKDEPNWKNILIMISALSLGMTTKAPAIILGIVSYFLAIYFVRKHFSKTSNRVFFSYLAIITIFIVGIINFISPINYLQILFSSGERSQFNSIFQSIAEYILTTKDRWNWSELSYWGNFGWLNARISSWIVNIIHLIEIIGIFGLISYFAFPKKIPEFLPSKKIIIFLIGILLGLQFTIRFADWSYFNSHNEIEYGTPGRYFLPVIFARFSLLIVGFGMIARRYGVWKNIIKVLTISMILLWTYSVLIVIIPRYYL